MTNGLYLNPGSGLFEESLASPLYVDKTMLISEVNKAVLSRDKYMCVSRPRRFGKSMALGMLAAYYSKGTDGKVFKGLKISNSAGFHKHLGKFNVLMLDFNDFYDNCGDDKAGMFNSMFDAVSKEFAVQFPNVSFGGNSIASLLKDAYSATGEKFVVLIDEYDALIRRKAADSLFERYLEFLNGLFKSLSVTQTIALAYMTGILPIVREKFQSKLNNFTEYTMLSPRNLLEFTGFTSREVETICAERGIDMDECRRWYDGYHMGEAELYSPKSVCELALTGRFASYWAATGSFEAVSDFISMDLDGISEDVNRLLSGESICVEVTSYENRMDRLAFNSKDDVFTYCIHLGYLSYDQDSETVRIPNYEVRRQWIDALKATRKYSKTIEIIKLSGMLLENVRKCRSELVAECLESAHREVSSNLSYNNEQRLQSAIMLAFIAARDNYTVIPELPSGNGFADVVFLPYRPQSDAPAIVVELKVDGTVDTGMEQILKRKYPDSLKHYKDNMILVAISYDRNTKKHAARVERLKN